MSGAGDTAPKPALATQGKLRKESSTKSTNLSKQQQQATNPDNNMDCEIYPENPCTHGSVVTLKIARAYTCV